MPQRADRGARRRSANVVDFDEALLDACPPEALAQVMTEAQMLARAFAPDGRARQIEELAGSLQSGVRHLAAGRAHARLLAAALRRLARGRGQGPEMAPERFPFDPGAV
jgi:hypothetical protein